MPADPNLLSTYLADADEPCPGCDYNLRGLTGNTCPECKQLLRLRVNLHEPRVAWFLIAIIGLSCGVGFNTFCLALMGYEVLSGSSAPSNAVWVVTLVGASLLVLAVCLTSLIRQRQRFARQSRTVRATLALTFCGLSLIAFALFAAGPR